jgi:hypothetical protein
MALFGHYLAKNHPTKNAIEQKYSPRVRTSSGHAPWRCPTNLPFPVIGHGDPIIAKRRDLLNSQLLVYNGDRQAPPGSSKSFQRFNRWQIQADG